MTAALSRINIPHAKSQAPDETDRASLFGAENLDEGYYLRLVGDTDFNWKALKDAHEAAEAEGLPEEECMAAALDVVIDHVESGGYFDGMGFELAADIEVYAGSEGLELFVEYGGSIKFSSAELAAFKAEDGDVDPDLDSNLDSDSVENTVSLGLAEPFYFAGGLVSNGVLDVSYDAPDR